jgi:hypothetical protein
MSARPRPAAAAAAAAAAAGCSGGASDGGGGGSLGAMGGMGDGRGDGGGRGVRVTSGERGRAGEGQQLSGMGGTDGASSLLLAWSGIGTLTSREPAGAGVSTGRDVADQARCAGRAVHGDGCKPWGD